MDAVKFLNDLVSKAMRWQEDPLIQHDTVKLYGELDFFYPNWSKDSTIPNFATTAEILGAADKLLAA